ncbi:hypothetical protein J6590_013466 [Homalodisca vitripennis]|nr:hypothetical protein J6590_013466 [Homalodisca vitripennis]
MTRGTLGESSLEFRQTVVERLLLLTLPSGSWELWHQHQSTGILHCVNYSLATPGTGL